MHDQSKKLDELRQLVERLEEEVSSFGALLDSADSAQNAELALQVCPSGLEMCKQLLFGLGMFEL